jgi:hypothetical protein
MNTKFCITEINDSIKVEIEGNAKTLINLIANVIESDERIRDLITFGLLTVMSNQQKEQISEEKEEEKLINLLSKMQIGLS